MPKEFDLFSSKNSQCTAFVNITINSFLFKISTLNQISLLIIAIIKDVLNELTSLLRFSKLILADWLGQGDGHRSQRLRRPARTPLHFG